MILKFVLEKQVLSKSCLKNYLVDNLIQFLIEVTVFPLQQRVLSLQKIGNTEHAFLS
jgi:hypothetical protein